MIVNILLRKRWWPLGWTEIMRSDDLQALFIERRALVIAKRFRVDQLAITTILLKD